MKKKLVLLTAVALALAVAAAACGKTDSEPAASSEAQSAQEIAAETQSTPAPTQEATDVTAYDFDLYVGQYLVDNNLTEADILADENLKLDMFTWLQDGEVSYLSAKADKEAGCTNVFIDDFMDWAHELANGFKPGEQPTTPPASGESTDTPSNVITDEEMDEILSQEGFEIVDPVEDSKLAHETGKAVNEWMTSEENLNEVRDFINETGITG